MKAPCRVWREKAVLKRISSNILMYLFWHFCIFSYYFYFFSVLNIITTYICIYKVITKAVYRVSCTHTVCSVVNSLQVVVDFFLYHYSKIRSASNFILSSSIFYMKNFEKLLIIRNERKKKMKGTRRKFKIKTIVISSFTKSSQ